jgi:hypothetical protein
MTAMAGKRRSARAVLLVALSTLLVVGPGGVGGAQAQGPTMLDPRLSVRTLVDGLVTPTSLAFLGADDLLVLEKNTGRVRRVVGGQVRSTVLDLPVNFGSERGLLGVALHPRFPQDPSVYLYWTQSSTGQDTDVLSQTPLLGNRVDRFVWDGVALTFQQHLISIRALQQDAAQPERGNHDGGVITFGPDGKLYILVGDVGRRGRLQNLPDGPFGPGVPDDQFGGPQPDDAHLTGVILRLNPDGTSPADNPFFGVGAAIGGQVGANLQKVFAYGLRNSFGMAFDPISGQLWEEENGDDSFTELNRSSRASTPGGSRSRGRRTASPSTRPSRPTPTLTRSPARSTSGSSRSGGRRPTSPTPPSRPCRGWLCCPAPATASQSSAGSSRLPRGRSALWPAVAWAPSSRATCLWAAPARSWKAGRCSTST